MVGLLPHGATAQRPEWDDLPTGVRRLVADRLGRAVVGCRSQRSGFTPGFAGRLTLADGTRAFVKACSAETPVIHAAYVQEAKVAAGLPPAAPATRLLWHATADGWLVLVFEDVVGVAPARPWRRDQLDAVLDMLPRLAASLTPAPAALGKLDTTADLDGELGFWRARAAGEPAAMAVRLPEPWQDRVAELTDLESRWASLAAGGSAVHFDLRDDNVLLTDDGRVLVCDWNWVARAAPWVDLAGLLVSAHGDGLDAERLWRSHPLAVGVPDEALDAFLAGLAGLFVRSSQDVPVPTSPWLRTHQAWWATATLGWLGQRLG